MFANINITSLILSLPVILLALSVHEASHGFVAYKLGDPTARNLGRLTLNPIKHINIWGFLCMLFFRFGWAKSVPVDTRYFKKPRRDMALTALAGPATNLILALIGAFIYSLSMYLLGGLAIEYKSFFYWVCYAYVSILINFVWLNIALAIFNLIPLPPLDGSRIFLVWLPDRLYFKVMRHEREIAMGFMALLILDSYVLDGILTYGLSFVVELIFDGMMSLFSLIF